MSTPAESIITPQHTPEKIVWSCVARNDVILAEAGQDNHNGLVTETARGLLARKPTPGYEFHQISRKWPFRNNKKHDAVGEQHTPRLRGCKFHLYEHDEDDVQNVRIWVFAAIYDTTLAEQIQVQSFLEKIVALTEIFREDDDSWRKGDTLACQATFAPILLQRMQEVTYLGKMAMLQERLDNSKQLMSQNVDLLLDREDQLRNQLAVKSSALLEASIVFKKRTRKVRRMKMMQNAKHGLILGTVVTAGVAVVVVPPLIAIL